MEDLSAAINALKSGDLSLAERICQRIIGKEPQRVRALHIMGIVGSMQGRPVKAFSYFKKAHALEPDNADILLNLGCMQLQLGRLHDSELSLRAAIKIQPHEAMAHSSLGNVLKRLGKYEEAVTCHEHAASLAPSSAEVHSNLASAYLAWNKIDPALEECRKALHLQPDSAELHFNLGTALQRGEQYEDACDVYRRALRLNPDHTLAHMNMGTSLKALGRVHEAISFLRRATELAPDFADAHWNLALTLLLAGDYCNGWKAYDWRLKMRDIPVRTFPRPLWDGSVQRDKTLLIHAEQGMGDTIQFIRYAADARKKVKSIILDCPEPLVMLFSDVKGVDTIVSTGRELPAFDIHLPLMSLPGALGAEPGDSINKHPYLKAEKGLALKWRTKMHSNNYRVGLVWAGNPKHEDDRNRSIDVTYFAPLLKIPEVTFYSLQKDTTDRGGINNIEGINIINAGPELRNFADTAALISTLDLVISVDTAAAHLAGALGCPVWVLLPYAPDWRWMMERDDTPWYPTMRLFRQERSGDWNGVIADVEEALRNMPGIRMRPERTADILLIN